MPPARRQLQSAPKTFRARPLSRRWGRCIAVGALGTLCLGLSVSLLFGDSTWLGTASNLWTNSVNWASGLPGSGATADFTGNGAATVDLNGNQSVGGFLFSGNVGYTLGDGALTIGSGGIAVSSPGAGSVTDTFSGSIAFSGSLTPISVGANATLALAGAAVSGTALTLSGAGALTMTGSSTFTGGATVNGGTLQIGSGGAGASFSGAIADNAAVQFNHGDTWTYGGIISGTGSLAHSGVGTLILTANSTYSGGTTINAGGLQFGNGGASGLVSGNFVNNGVVTFDRSDDLTYANVISGSGSLVKIGADTVIISMDQTYSGTTTISSGTLQLGNGGASGTVAGDIINNSKLIFNRSGATLDFSGNITGTGSLTKSGSATVRLGGADTFSGGITINGGVLTIGTAGATGSITSDVVDGSTLIFNRTTNYSYGGNISGSGSIYKVNSNILTLTGSNTYAGVTHIEGGELNFTSLSNLGNGGTITLDGGALQWATGNTADISARTVFVDTGGGNLDTNGNNVILANIIGNNGSGVLTKSGLGTLTLQGANTFTGGMNLNAGVLNFSALGNLGSGNLTFNGGTLQWAGGNTADISARTVSILSGGATLDTGSNSFTFASAIGNSGLGSLTKVGSGKLTLTGSNTYVGSTIVNNGALRIGSGGATGSIAGALTVGINGTVYFDRSDNVSFTKTIDGFGAIFQIGSGTLSLSNLSASNQLSVVAQNGGTVSFPAGTVGPLIELAVGNPDNGSVGTVNIDGAGTSLSIDILTVGGDGAATLNLTNGASMSTDDNSPAFVGSGRASADAGINISGTNSTYIATNPLELDFNTSNNTGGYLSISNGGAATVKSLMSAGRITLDGGTLGVTTTSTSTNPITLNSGGGTLKISSGATLTLNAAISGSGGLTVSGPGTLKLGTTNTYTGATLVSGGSLTVNGSLSPGSAVTVAGGATLGGSGAIGGATTLTGPSGTYSATSASVINGSGLTLSGAVTITGNATLSGTETASSGVTLSQGTTIVSGAISGSLVVGANGVLGLTGSAGAVNVSGVGSVFAPGSSTGGLATSPVFGLASGNVTLASSSDLVISLGINAASDAAGLDLFTAGASLSLGNSLLTVDLGANYAHVDLQTFVIFNGAGSNGVVGQFSQGSLVTGVNPSNTNVTDRFFVYYNVDATGKSPGSDIVLQALPEPSDGVLLALGMSVAALFRRRR